MRWDIWDSVHSEGDQKKRIARAYKAENTPVEISKEDFTGKFVGNHGHYETSLDRCTCVDFIRRKKPCKHMYRLAIELNLFGNASKAVSDTSAQRVPKKERDRILFDLVANLENFPDKTQWELRRIMLKILYKGKSLVSYKKIEPIKELIDCGFLEIIAPATASQINVKLSKTVILVHRRLYSYLTRKFDTVDCYNPYTDECISVPKGAEFVAAIEIGVNGAVQKFKLAFPNDEVTALLDLYGVNRCDKWNEENNMNLGSD